MDQNGRAEARPSESRAGCQHRSGEACPFPASARGIPSDTRRTVFLMSARSVFNAVRRSSGSVSRYAATVLACDFMVRKCGECPRKFANCRLSSDSGAVTRPGANPIARRRSYEQEVRTHDGVHPFTPRIAPPARRVAADAPEAGQASRGFGEWAALPFRRVSRSTRRTGEDHRAGAGLLQFFAFSDFDRAWCRRDHAGGHWAGRNS